MSLKSVLGLDLVDLVIHAGVTGCLLALVGVTNGPEGLYPSITGLSFLALAVRRHFALKRGSADLTTGGMNAARLEEFEQRLQELEGVQARILELEERLDFAERLLTRGTTASSELRSEP